MDTLRRQGFFILAALLLVTSFTVTTGASQGYAVIPQLAAAVSVCAGLVVRETITGILATAALAFGANYYLFDQKLQASAGKSSCDIDAIFTCTAVNASPYSMAFGVPITLIGMAFYAGLVIACLVTPSGKAKTATLPRLTALFGAGSVLYSLFLFKISHDMGVYCVFCITIYAANVVLLGAGLRGVKETGAQLLGDLPAALQSKELLTIVGTFVVGIAWGKSHFDTQTATFRALTQKPADARGSDPKGSTTTPPKPPTPEEEAALVAKIYAQTRGVVEVTGKEPTKGAVDGKYLLVEFADFGCPHCAEAADELDTLLQANPDLQVRYKYFPLSPACNPMIAAASGQQDPDPGRCRATYAAECAHQQGKFWEMSKLLFHNQGGFPSEQLKDFATQLRLDLPKWEECLGDPKTAATVEASARAGEALGIHGTPSFYLKGVFPDFVETSYAVPGVMKLLEAHHDGLQLPQPKPPEGM